MVRIDEDLNLSKHCILETSVDTITVENSVIFTQAKHLQTPPSSSFTPSHVSNRSMYTGTCAQLLSHVPLFAILLPARLLCPWDFPSKNTGVGCRFHLYGNLPDLRIKLASSALAGRFFISKSPGKHVHQKTSSAVSKGQMQETPQISIDGRMDK